MEHKHTPNAELLKAVFSGNDEYVKSHDKAYFRKFKNHQHPEITLLTCSDSRVQVNILGLDAMNEIFVVRNMGNQIMPAFGSIDFGVIHLKTPLLIIMGHTHCGAIKAVFSNYEEEPFDIIRELDHLSIPVRHIKHRNHDFEHEWLHIVEESLDYQVHLAIKKYEVLINEGKLTVIGLIDDFTDAYKSGEGRLILANINGEKNPHHLIKHPLLSGLSDDEKSKILKRK